MKNLTRVLAILVFASLCIFISCKKKSGSDPDPLDVQAAKLTAATWVTESVSKDNVSDGIGDWSGFTLDFQYDDETDVGQYTVAGLPANDGSEDVFGEEGENITWNFANLTNTSTVVRPGDGVSMTVSVNDASTSLTISFTIPDSGNRVAGFDGEWEFNLVAQ